MPASRELVDDLVVGQLLGREQDELDVVLLRVLQDLVPLAVGEGRVDDRRLLLDRLHLVLLEGDERRDDDRRPVDDEPGQLVDGRLAGARRHDGERVPAREDGLDRLELARAERLEAEALAGKPFDFLGGGGQTGSTTRSGASRARRGRPGRPSASPRR